MTVSSFEQTAYELPEIWDADWFPQEDHDRVHTLATLVPQDARTLLDVGCGNGLFLNHLKEIQPDRFDRLVGVDRSARALTHVQTENRRARITALPFADAEFDLVTCAEVLEHIPLPSYAKSLSEIARVASRSIIICVPNEQDLEASLSKCPACLARFNADFHVRSYNAANLAPMFEGFGFAHCATYYLGPRSIRPDQEFRANLSKMLRKPLQATFPSYAVCPVCGYTEPKH